MHTIIFCSSLTDEDVVYLFTTNEIDSVLFMCKKDVSKFGTKAKTPCPDCVGGKLRVW